MRKMKQLLRWNLWVCFCRWETHVDLWDFAPKTREAIHSKLNFPSLDDEVAVRERAKSKTVAKAKAG